MDQLEKNHVLSQLHPKYWLLIRREASLALTKQLLLKNFKRPKIPWINWLSLCKVHLPNKGFMFSFNLCQLLEQERTISKALLHLLENHCLRYQLLYIIHNIYDKYLSELNSKNIKNCAFLYT